MAVAARLMDPLTAAKAKLREAALIRRAGQNPNLGSILAGHVLRHCLPPPGSLVAGFWPLAGEIDIRPLLMSLAANFELCLPVTPSHGQPLSFRPWLPDAALLSGRFGTRHPAAERTVSPDYLLVPLLAFDNRGHRLGYGGGYYDRSFAQLPAAFRLGCAFAAQEFPEIPTGPHDLKLHAVATEDGIKQF